MLNDDTANLLSDLPGNFDSVMQIQIQTFGFKSDPTFWIGTVLESGYIELKTCNLVFFFLVDFKSLKV